MSQSSSVFGDLDPLSDATVAPSEAVPSAAPGEAEATTVPSEVAPSDAPSEAAASAETPEVLVDVGDPPAQLTALEEARQEAANWKEIALRTAAEFENFRKRAVKDQQDARKFGNAALLESLLPVLDNFEFGLQAARAENEGSSIFVGMSMVHKQLQEFLKDQGVEEVPSLGQKFDPNVHEAVGQQPSAEFPEGIVTSQVRKGYRLRDRLLRPATVIVSSGPPASNS